MSFSIKLGNFLYRHAFALYRPMYYRFKRKQDRFEIELLKKYVRPGHTVLDIGANIGFYAELLANLVGDKGSVHCFEPDAQNFGYLQKALKKYSNVVLNNNAVGAKTETLKFYTSPNLNVDHRSYEPEVYEQVTEVAAVSIDDYLAAHPQSIDIIKMDIQGFEMQALKGMQQCLTNNKHLILISEFWPYGLRKAGSSLLSYYEALVSYGFDVYLMEHAQLKKLAGTDVAALADLGEEHYFNILATRNHV